MKRNYSTEERECKYCEEKYQVTLVGKGKYSLFCSNNCKKKYYYKTNPKPKKSKICVYCGEEFTPKHNGRKTCSDECSVEYQKIEARKREQKYSKIKAEQNPIKPRACLYCGIEFTPDRQHAFQRFCKPKHANQYHSKKERPARTQKEREAREKIACGNCGTMFTPTKHLIKYCSTECQERAYQLMDEREKEKARLFRIAHPPQLTKRICRWCGKEFEATGRWMCCNAEHSYLYLYGFELPKERVRTCEWCGKEYKTNHKKSRGCCPKHANRISKRERIQRMRAVIHVPYSRWEIYQRDKFTCHICGAPIDMDAIAPLPYSPSIDHVIPIKAGGADADYNVKAAHFICNSVKSDRLLQ